MIHRPISLIAVSFLLLGGICRADQLHDTFAWPNKLFTIDWNKGVDVTVDLPYLPLDDGPKPKTRYVYYLDLNDDGEKEMIVRLGRDGITTDFAIFQRIGTKWKEIGSMIGLCAVCEKRTAIISLRAIGNTGVDQQAGNFIDLSEAAIGQCVPRAMSEEYSQTVPIGPKGCRMTVSSTTKNKARFSDRTITLTRHISTSAQPRALLVRP
jgi:hypothetical protein